MKELEGFGEIEQLAGGSNIQLGGSIQRVGDQYRPWGFNQKNWEINYTREKMRHVDKNCGIPSEYERARFEFNNCKNYCEIGCCLVWSCFFRSASKLHQNSQSAVVLLCTTSILVVK